MKKIYLILSLLQDTILASISDAEILKIYEGLRVADLSDGMDMVGLPDAGLMDTDEIIKQRIPVYLDYMERGRGIRPGRNEIESVNMPVTIGGVLVRPGDVIVADGDGVIVVPREHCMKVAEYAREILNKDKKGRRGLYENLGMPIDRTVETNE